MDLEEISAVAEKILIILGGHWPFVALALILGLIGEVVKATVIGDNEVEAEKTQWKRVFNRTLPLHPVVVGALVGAFLSTTVPDVAAVGGMVSSALYFGCAGVASTWLYKTTKRALPEIVAALQSKLLAGLNKVKKTP